MAEILTRRRHYTEFWWECPRCGYCTHKYTDSSMPNYYMKKHEPVCARAAELGLMPIFRNDDLHSHNTYILGWMRESDGAALEIHSKIRRYAWVRCAEWEEARKMGYSQSEWEHESERCTKKETWFVDEIHFVIDGDWHRPVEIYEVPTGWDWREHGAPIPWDIV